MLSIEPSTNAHAALRYFRENLALQDYYCEKTAITGQWHGKVAEILGLSGDVQAKDFEALLFNINPKTKDRLTARNSASRRPMYDCTFSASKSVSIVYAITGDKDILKAHQAAVRRAMEELEANVQTQVGTGRGKHYETTSNVLYAEFVHETSRPLKKDLDKGKALIPDPQLHSHCTLINATWYDKQKRFRAVEMGNVKAQASYFEALYHSYLAHNLKAAGYAIERQDKRWEIAGISRELIEKFSGRTLEIEAVAEKRGIISAKAKAKLGRLTRNDKNSDVQDHELQSIWKERLTLSEYHAIINSKGGNHGGGGSGAQETARQLSAEKVVDLSLNHFFERHSGIQEKRVLAYAIDLASGILPADVIKKELAQRDNILRADRNTVSYITTKEMLSQEQQLLDRAIAGRATKPGLNPSYQITNEVLNEGQRAAIEHILTSKDQLIMLSGDAGVGKTTLLTEVKAGIEENGKKLFAFAPSADAAREVMRSKGFEGAETIAKLLKSKELQEQLKNNVMLVDEAGLVGVYTANKLLAIAEKQNSRVIFSGDWKQHSAVEAGDAMKLLETKSNMKVARVSEIVRQQKAENYKALIMDIAKAIGTKKSPEARRDKVVKVFGQLDKNGNVIEINHTHERQEQIANDYVALRTKEESVIVIAPTHREGKEITGAIRNGLKANGMLGQEDTEYTRLQSKQFTGSEKQMPQHYSKDDVVEFHQNLKGFKAGHKYQIEKVDERGNILVKGSNDQEARPLPLDQHGIFEVYKPETINLAVNDKIRITKNTKSMGGRELYNGQVYDIKGFDASGNITLSNGQTLNKDARHFNHGYCTTSDASQGKDAQTVLIAQSSTSFGASNDKQFYVSISRGIQNCKVYTDDKQALKQAISRSGDRVSAGEIAQLVELDKKLQTQKALGYRERMRNYYESRIRPHIENLKAQYEQRRIEKAMGGPQRGLQR